MILAVTAVAHRNLQVQPQGLLLGVLSGAVASGMGYVLWYQALAGLSKVAAAIVQLAVPVLAAAGGIVLLGEQITLRFLLASVLVLGGIALGLATPMAMPAAPLDRPHPGPESRSSDA